MSTQRTFAIALLTFTTWVCPANGSDFRTRLAAWQGGEPVAPPAATPEAKAEELPPQAAPAGTSGRMLSNSYSAPMHSPDYNNPWRTCPWPHGPTYAAPADPYGTCDMVGGIGMLGSSGPGCGSCGGAGCGDYCGTEGPWCCETLVWAKFEVLMWWRQGRDYPPLVTTDSVTASPTEAGTLPDAAILFGDGRDGTNMQAGLRFDIGWWCDPRQCVGYGWRFFVLGKDSGEFNIDSLDNPVLAVPFRDVDADDNEAILIAFPSLRSGEIHIAANSDIVGNDLYGRFLLCRDHDSRLDFITGWHYSRIKDAVAIRTRSTITEVGGTIPQGTEFNTFDEFEAHSEFNGGILGLMWEGNCGCCTTNLMARMSLGNMHEIMRIRGSNRIDDPLTPPVTDTGGIFTAASNIGEFTRDEFTAVTEVGLTFAYRFRPCTQLTVGYSFLYWSDALNPGHAIDTGVSPSGAADRPSFSFRHSDYWAQGINLGLQWQF